LREDLVWERCRHRIDVAIVRHAQERLGIEFPSEYVEIVLRCDGGTPRPNKFVYNDPDIGPVISGLAALLSLDEARVDNIFETLTNLSDELPRRVIPFGEDGGGDYTCFDFRTAEGLNPSIVYWSHEREAETALIRLSDSFSSFLNMLQNDPSPHS
jgi:hypothetical protein